MLMMEKSIAPDKRDLQRLAMPALPLTINVIISGNYCPRGTKSEKENQCPPGTFSNKIGLISASQCDPCSPGKFCAGSGNVKPTADCATGITFL